MYYIKYILFLIISIIGNPFYQMIAYVICNEMGYGRTLGTNVYQVDLLIFILIMVLIFLVRLLIYGAIFTSKQYPFSVKGNTSFLYIFLERHLYLVIGIFSFLIWTSPLEGNIVGFFVFPFTLLLGTALSIVTFVRILKTKKIHIAKSEQA